MSDQTATADSSIDGGTSALSAGLEGNVRQLAILQISPELLRELFQLPDGAEVVDLRVPIDYRGLLEVKIVGAGWPTLEGQAIMRTIGTVTREFDAGGAEVRRSINWGLPSNAELATTPHAVRWAQREIFGRFEMQYSKWHWTTDASHTICGRPIQLIADGPALLPETYDDPAKVTCKRCRALLAANDQVRAQRR